MVAANTDDLPNPAGGTVVHRVLSARDMADKVGEVAGEQDVIIMPRPWRMCGQLIRLLSS